MTKKRKRDYSAEYQRRSLHSKLCNWYKSSDKKNGRENNLSSADVKKIIEQPCKYCKAQPANGIDRLDNSKGHIKINCVPCCAKCNMILIDLPAPAKLLLSEGLQKIRERNILKDWQPPPFREI